MSATTEGTVPQPMLVGGHPVGWICRASIVVAIVGVFGSWRNAGGVSLDGVEGPHNGWLVFIFALIALAGVGSLSRGSWLGIVTVLGSAAVMVSTAVHDVVSDGDVIGGSAGWGVWMTVAAAIGLGGCAVLAAVLRVRQGGAVAEPAAPPTAGS